MSHSSQHVQSANLITCPVNTRRFGKRPEQFGSEYASAGLAWVAEISESLSVFAVIAAKIYMASCAEITAIWTQVDGMYFVAVMALAERQIHAGQSDRLC